MKFLQALILVIVLLECQGFSSSVIKQGTDDAKPGNDAPKPVAPTKTNGSATFFSKQSIFIFALISNIQFFLM